MHFSDIVINKGYEGINPLLYGYETCERLHSCGPAARTYWLLHFVVSGKGLFQIRDKQYRLSKGMLFVISPFEEVFYEADSEEPWEYIWVGFTGTPPIKLNDCYDIPEALRIFQHMKSARNLSNGKTEFLLAQLWEIFSLLLEGERVKRNPIEEALNLIYSQYMTPLTVQQIADAVCLERTYFSNIFTKKMGCSPKQFLMKYRMEQAQKLLSRGYSVTTTAISVGYSDVYTFSKMFKQQFGQSPSRYQENVNE